MARTATSSRSTKACAADALLVVVVSTSGHPLSTTNTLLAAELCQQGGEVDAPMVAGCECLRAGLEWTTAAVVRGAGARCRGGRLACATGEGARAGGGHDG